MAGARKASVEIAEISLASEARRIGALACESAARLLDAVERLRWTILERQADHDVDAGRVREFPSGQAAVAFLRGPHP